MNTERNKELIEIVLQASVDADFIVSLMEDGTDKYLFGQFTKNRMLMEALDYDQDLYDEVSEPGFTMTRSQVDRLINSRFD